MKKRLLCLLSACLLFGLFCLSFFACAKEKTLTVLFENGEETKSFSVRLADYPEGAKLYDVLKKETSMKAEMDETTTPYVTSLCGVTPDAAKNAYIAVYTSLASDAWGNTQLERNGVTLFYAAVGIAELPLTEDAVYLFRVESW